MTMRSPKTRPVVLAIFALLAACSGESNNEPAEDMSTPVDMNTVDMNVEPPVDMAMPSPELGVDAGADLGGEDMAAPFPSGRIAYWAFDEGEGTTASDSEGTHDATLLDGTTWSEGQAGMAVTFDGIDDRVDIPDHEDFDFGGGDWTISAWFKTTSEKDQHIVNFRQNDNEPHIELYAVPGGFGPLGSHILPNDTRISNDVAVNDGVWHHAAVTLQNGVTDGYELYLDGAVVAQGTYTGDQLMDWDTIQIGAAGTMPRQFDGSIDEVMIFDRALTTDEMQQVYEHGLREQ